MPTQDDESQPSGTERQMQRSIDRHQILIIFLTVSLAATCMSLVVARERTESVKNRLDVCESRYEAIVDVFKSRNRQRSGEREGKGR